MFMQMLHEGVSTESKMRKASFRVNVHVNIYVNAT
jgi:hypothetical protein